MSLLVFSDMDGTFLADNKSIPRQNLDALDELAAQHAGWFVPCTGRPAPAVPPVLLAHPCCRYVVSANGGQIHEVGQNSALKLIREHALGRERTRALVDALIGHDVTFDIFTSEGIFDRQSDYDRMDQFVEAGPTLDFVRSLRTPRGNDIYQLINQVHPVRMTIFYKSEKSRIAVLDAVERMGTVSCVSSMPNEFEISDCKATKGEALRSLMQLLEERSENKESNARTNEDSKRNLSETYSAAWQSVAFGDSSNDVPMLQVADFSFAMKNATPEVLQAARSTTAFDNNNGGVGQELLALLGRKHER